MNDVQNMASCKYKYVKKFNTFGQTQREKCAYRYNKECDHPNHKVEKFAYYLNYQGK